MTHKFCTELNKLLTNNSYSRHKIYHYCSTNPSQRANAAYLMGAFQVIVLKRTALEAWKPFSKLPKFFDYRDASFGMCSYKCTLLHCFQALEKAISLGWYSMDSFDSETYEKYEKVENGDLNWIIPGKFLAFSSPYSNSVDSQGWRNFTPSDYIPIFREFRVTTVVRLNKKTYDSEDFKKQGLKHYDLYFIDGSCPSLEIVQKFLEIAEREKTLAVHCKAGLGRTGTLIGCYAMKHYNISANEFIAWARICRPGSVLGPQQHFLIEMESQCRSWGRCPVRHGRNLSDGVSMSPDEKKVALSGDKGQAKRLNMAKRSNQNSPSERKPLYSRSIGPSNTRKPSHRAKAVQNIFMGKTNHFNHASPKKSSTLKPRF